MGRVAIQPVSRRRRMLSHLFPVAVIGLAFSTALSASSDAESRRSAPKSEPVQETSTGPRTIVISIRKQRLRLFDGKREIASTRISSGRSGFDTPTGVFSILEKQVYHESNIYAGAPMPFMQRITWSGIAMHAGVVPGYRASHGCVRLPYSFAKTFFRRTDVGGRVIIINDEVAPQIFEHPALFKPLPEFDPPASSEGASTLGAVVAANDATAADKAALNSLVAGATTGTSVPPANAGKPRSRADALRQQAERLERLKAAMEKAQEEKAAATEQAKSALRAAQDAEANYQSVRKPFEDVLKAAADAQDARERAGRAYREFLTKLASTNDEPKNSNKNSKRRSKSKDDDISPDDREFDLEERLLDLTVEVDETRAASAEADLVIADAKTKFAAAEAAKTRALEEVKQAVVELRKAQTALVEARAEAQRRDRQLSIFVSLKSQRIIIRQGFEQVFEAPIEVDDPPGAIGTHVLTALDYDSTGNNFVWQLVSAQPPRPAVDVSSSKKKKERPQPVSVNSPLNLEAVRAALDSVRIPEEIVDRIAELAKPGTSLIISEKDPSHETGKGTDFVVLTR